MGKQTKEVTIQKAEAKKDSEGVEPSGRDVQNARKSTKKQHLVEGKNMANPPPLIKMTLESTGSLLSKSSPGDWEGIRAGTMKGNFIPGLVDPNTDDVKDVIRKTFARDYLSNSENNKDDGKDICENTENCKTGFELEQVKFGTIVDNRITTDDPAEAKAAGEARWAVTKDAEKKMMDEEVEREKAEAKAAEKGEAEEEEDLDGIDKEEEKAKHRGKRKAEKL